MSVNSHLPDGVVNVSDIATGSAALIESKELRALTFNELFEACSVARPTLLSAAVSRLTDIAEVQTNINDKDLPSDHVKALDVLHGELDRVMQRFASLQMLDLKIDAAMRAANDAVLHLQKLRELRVRPTSSDSNLQLIEQLHKSTISEGTKMSIAKLLAPELNPQERTSVLDDSLRGNIEGQNLAQMLQQACNSAPLTSSACVTPNQVAEQPAPPDATMSSAKRALDLDVINVDDQPSSQADTVINDGSATAASQPVPVDAVIHDGSCSTPVHPMPTVPGARVPRTTSVLLALVRKAAEKGVARSLARSFR